MNHQHAGSIMRDGLKSSQTTFTRQKRFQMVLLANFLQACCAVGGPQCETDVCVCGHAHSYVWVHCLYNNQLQSAESQSQMSHSSADSRFSMSHNDILMVGLSFSRHIKGQVCPLSSETGCHRDIRKYKLTNTLTHQEFSNPCTHEYMQRYIQRKWQRETVQLGEHWGEEKLSVWLSEAGNTFFQQC